MSYTDYIKSIQSDLMASDLSRGIDVLMFDEDNHPLHHHPIDIRTDLIDAEIKSMSLANYLTAINMRGLKPRNQLFNLDPSVYEEKSLAINLNILMLAIKRHKISKKRESRVEIVKLLGTKVNKILDQFNKDKKEKNQEVKNEE